MQGGVAMKTRIAIVVVIILLMPVLAFAIVRKCNAEKPAVQTEQTCDDTQSVVVNEEEIAAEEPKPDVIVIVERPHRPVLHFCGRVLHRLIRHPFHRCGK
jgi:hypothetical protein